MISFAQLCKYLRETSTSSIYDTDHKVYIPQENEETNVVFIKAWDYDEDYVKEAFVGYFRGIDINNHICWIVVPERKLARKLEFREIIYRPEIPDNAKTEIRFDEAQNAWSDAPKSIKNG